MLRGRRVSTAVAVVYWLCVSTGPGWAGDDDESHTILFSGRDLWGNGAFA
jgi:hypothetical protein